MISEIEGLRLIAGDRGNYRLVDAYSCELEAQDRRVTPAARSLLVWRGLRLHELTLSGSYHVAKETAGLYTFRPVLLVKSEAAAAAQQEEAGSAYTE